MSLWLGVQCASFTNSSYHILTVDIPPHSLTAFQCNGRNHCPSLQGDGYSTSSTNNNNGSSTNLSIDLMSLRDIF